MTSDPHNHPELDARVEELATAVLGRRRSEFRGGGRYEEEGLVHKVDALLDKGIKIKLPWQVWAAIITTLGGVAVQLIAALSTTPG